MKYADLVTDVPQSESLKPSQVKNNAGGFVFQIDDWARLDRFLILGSDAPTYYQKARELTRENAACVKRCYDADPIRTVFRISEVSYEALAPKNDAAIFALAIGAAHPNVEVRQLALQHLSTVCRISTHLFQFVTAVRALGRGWGRSLVRAVANWYESKPADKLAYQMIKYREREGYSHNRLIRTSHPSRDKSVASPEHQALYRWVCGKEDHGQLPAIVDAHLLAMKTENRKELLQLITDFRLPWEAIPTEAKKDPEVWEAMLPFMGLTALIRNLGTMSRVGTLKPLAATVKTVVDRITDSQALAKDRIHPFTIMQAMAVYASGKAVRGSSEWPVIGPIVDALAAAFYEAFKHIEPSGKRTLIGLDVSGSMGSSFNDSPLTVRAASGAMAMATIRTEANWHCVGFTSGAYRRGTELTELPITAKDSLDTVVRKISGLPFGGTDCALPMLYAGEKGFDVDTFIIYTDNETWAGNVHPCKALEVYRKQSGIPAKLVVVGMTSTGFSIADQNDGGMLDVVGFDSSCPALIADFSRDAAR